MQANPEIWVYSKFAASQVEELVQLSTKSCITRKFLGKCYPVETHLKGGCIFVCFIVYFQIYLFFKNS